VDGDPGDAEPRRRRRLRVWSVNTEAAYHEEGEAVEALLEVDLV
jgi:hypothetical protein